MFLFCLVFALFCARLFICALWSPAGKGLTSWLSFVVSSVSLSLSHWYPGSGVVLDCIDSWSLHHYLLSTGKGLPLGIRLMSNCEVVTFPLVYSVRFGAWLYRFLIFALFLTFHIGQQSKCPWGNRFIVVHELNSATTCDLYSLLSSLVNKYIVVSLHDSHQQIHQT